LAPHRGCAWSGAPVALRPWEGGTRPGGPCGSMVAAAKARRDAGGPPPARLSRSSVHGSSRMARVPSFTGVPERHEGPARRPRCRFFEKRQHRGAPSYDITVRTMDPAHGAGGPECSGSSGQTRRESHVHPGSDRSVPDASTAALVARRAGSCRCSRGAARPVDAVLQPWYPGFVVGFRTLLPRTRATETVRTLVAMVTMACAVTGCGHSEDEWQTAQRDIVKLKADLDAANKWVADMDQKIAAAQDEIDRLQARARRDVSRP
jgi:hypothetical protein